MSNDSINVDDNKEQTSLNNSEGASSDKSTSMSSPITSNLTMYEQNSIAKKIRIDVLKKKYSEIAKDNDEVIKRVLILNTIVALLSTILFAADNRAYIGLSIFTILVSILLLCFLAKEKLIENKKAFLWLIPINLIAFSNALFVTNLHVLNIIVIHILFSIMFVQATNTRVMNIFDTRLFTFSLRNFIPNFLFTKTSLTEVVLPSEKNKTLSIIKNIVIGLCMATPFLFVVVLLLSVADANFSSLLFGKSFNISIAIYKIINFIVATVVFFLYSTKIIYLKYQEPKEVRKAGFNDIILSTFLLCLNVVYLVFLYLQSRYFITGGLLSLPDGFTYSEYANEGFLATFFVTLINFGIIIFISEFTKIKFDSIVFKINFAIIFISNSLLIFTAFVRTYIYIDVYGYTTTRQSVILVLILQFILMLLLLSKVAFKTQFYKVATLTIVAVYLLQCYTSNDYVTTYLNFQKFDITANDSILIVSFDERNDDGYYYKYGKYFKVTKDGSDHSITFPVTADSSAYIIDITQDAFVNYNLSQSNPYHTDLPFFSRTIFELKLEKILEDEFFNFAPVVEL